MLLVCCYICYIGFFGKDVCCVYFSVILCFGIGISFINVGNVIVLVDGMFVKFI